MTRSAIITLAISTLCLLAGPAVAAGRIPGGGGLLPLPNPYLQMQRQMAAPVARGPYPMTYSEQVAESLGVRNGRVDLFESRDSARNPYAPSISVGGGSMIQLRWKQ